MPTPVKAFPGDTSGQEPAYHCRRCKRCRFNPWIRKIPEERNGNPLQYSSLENPMDRGAWWATVHRVTKSWTGLKQLSTHAPTRLDYKLQKSRGKVYVV